MQKIEETLRKSVLIGVFVTLAVILTAGCTARGTMTTSTPNLTQPRQAVQPDQFISVVKDGVEIACPKDWYTYSTDPNLFYGVYRLDTIRIVIGIVLALSQSYYDGLVTQGTVQRIAIGGYPAYRNDYTYTLSGRKVTNICVTAVSGNRACHFMFLCDTEALDDYQPVFNYVLNSLKFL